MARTFCEGDLLPPKGFELGVAAREALFEDLGYGRVRARGQGDQSEWGCPRAKAGRTKAASEAPREGFAGRARACSSASRFTARSRISDS